YEGMDEFPDVPTEVRNSWEAKFEKEGLPILQDALKKLDPDYFDEVDLQNPVRLIRALSVCTVSGQSYSSFRKAKKQERPFESLLIYLDWPRQILYDRINRRVDQMLAEGLEEEVRSLLPYRHYQALQTVGYPEFFAYFDGEITYEEAVERMKMNSRRYAKRQGTWFRKYGEWKTFSGEHPEKVLPRVETRLKELSLFD
ncbi:MAG: tRNA (adenosine(37)-N6)-dimethylallyltransferase MiaA, partial [Saprospiraceae bacterium]|nr:tRNA (adenosine(37)-N6)-dimethylallyltransferase MiaA [Saprospiraceae bacterium]